MKADKRRKSRNNEEWIPTSFKKWNSVVENFNRYEQKPKEKINPFLKLKEGLLFTILNRAMKKILFNKLFLLITILTILAFLASNLLGIFVLKPERLDLKTICNTWVPFGILIFYVMFYEIFSVYLLFYEDHLEGMINLEIRSGYHKPKIFFERMLANKIIIWFVLSLLIAVQFVIGYFVENLYIQTEIKKTFFGFLLIYLLDLVMFGLLILFVNQNSSIPLSIVGTFFGFLLIFSFVSNTISVNVLENKYNSESNLTIKEKNSKYYFMYRMQNLIQKYGGDNSILGKSINAFYELRYLVTDKHFNNETGFYTQNQVAMETYLPWHYLKKPYLNFDDYVLELMANGLILYINQIPVYLRLEPNANPTNLDVDSELMETNYLFQFLNSLTPFQSTKFGYNFQTAQNSLFRGFNKDEEKSDGLFSGDDGLFKFVERMKIDEEHAEIGQLIQDAAFYLYQDKYQNAQSDHFDSLSPALETDLEVHIWKYNLHQPDAYNQMLLDKVFVDDGARTFTKIFFELLINFMSLSEPNYGVDEHDQKLQPTDYQSQVKMWSYFNPLNSLTRSFFELGGDDSFSNTNYLNGWIAKTYEIVDDKKIFRNVIAFPNNELFLRISLKQSYFNDPDYGEQNLMLEDLNNLINENLQQFLPDNPELTYEYFVDFNKKIPVEKTPDSFVIDFQVKEKNETHFRGYVNFKISFKLASLTDLPEQEEQKKQLMAAFENPESYEKYSKFFNQFINGKNFQSIKEDSPNYHPKLVLIAIPVLGLICLCLGYWLFSKNLIK